MSAYDAVDGSSTGVGTLARASPPRAGLPAGSAAAPPPSDALTSNAAITTKNLTSPPMPCGNAAIVAGRAKEKFLRRNAKLNPARALP